MYPQRLPIVDDDDGVWGDILRKYLLKEHYDSGTDNAANGGHKNVTIRGGTAGAGGAPLKFTSGTLLTTPEVGAMEFAGDNLYLTQTSSTTRKKIALYDDANGATGDMYYRDATGYFTRLAAGTSSQVLMMSSGLPSWQTPTLDKNTVGLGNVDNTSDATKNSAVATLTNKRINPRVVTVTQSATPAINTDNGDVFIITGLAQNITSMTSSLSGTPVDSQRIRISITGTAARTIAWGASFENSTYRVLPATTVSTTRLDVEFIWNATTSKWRIADENYGVGGTDVSVADGGTGRSTSTTPYGIIAAGTSATGAQQTIAPGTSGQFLKSAGASALGSFANITAADITGTTAQFNTALSDGDFATLAGTETLTNKTLTNPKIGTILDANGNTSLDIINNPSAVNHVYISNQPTGAYPGLGVDGTDANIGFDIIPKGNGAVRIYATTGNTPTLQAVGSSTNLNMNLVSKGTGRVQANGVDIPTASSTDTLTNKTLDGSSNTFSNVPWAAVSKPAVIAAGDSITEALSEVDMYPLVGATDIGNGKQFGAFAANALYSHPESGWFVPIPHAYNDLAYNNVRGGSVEVRVNGSVYAASGNNAAAAFAPDATYEFVDYYGSTSDTVTFEITLHRTFFWGYRYGIQQTDWCRGQNVTFEAYNGTSWTTLSSISNHNTGLCWAAGDAASTGITRLRVSLTNFNSSSARVTQIFLIGFDSSLFSGTFLPRGGGQLYGDLQAPAVRTSLIRDTTNNIGVLDIYGVASAVNYLQVQNAATGNTPGIYAQGANANININLVPKGTGRLQASGNTVISSVNAVQAVTGTPSSSNYLRGDGTWSTPSGGLTWSQVTGTSQTAAVNTGYITNNAALVTVTLPSTAAIGQTVRVAGKGAGGWRVAQNASQVIHFGNVDSTTGTGGRLDSGHRYDSVELVCITANTDWVVTSSVGNINVT